MLDDTFESILSENPDRAPERDTSDARVPLLAFVCDEDTETALRAGLLNLVEGAEIHRGTILHAIKHLAKEPTPRALIVDIAHVQRPIEQLENLACVCTPDVKVLVIGEDTGVGFYRELVRNMGVAEYVHKPLTREHVTRLFVPQIAGMAPDGNSERGGSVIAVCGARGGVGTTTVAVNLALQLTAATRGHVALLDLHLRQGTTALMLGLKPEKGLRIALEQPERADALFLDRAAVEVNDRLRLIAADEALDGTPSPTPDGMRRVLNLLRRRFKYVVIDMPLPANPAEMQVLHEARHLIAVMAPDLASIRDTVRFRELAASFGNCHTTIVLNHAGMLGGLKIPLIEQGLGAKPTIQIPTLAKRLSRAANLGKPALNECTPFRKAMALLAQEVSGTPANRGGRSRFRWRFGR
jgi:pilus assembly protein CpaE